MDVPMIVAMIPARMGSRRLPHKNLRTLGGVPLITRVIRRCVEACCFDEIWVNGSDEAFENIARAEGVAFHRRPDALGSDTATSEDYVEEFLRNRRCEFVVQAHSIAPLTSVIDTQGFAEHVRKTAADVVLSVEATQLECLYAGRPINFSFAAKTNSQDLQAVHRITWSLSAWRRTAFLRARDEGRCATYAGTIEVHPLGQMAGYVVKTAEDLALAEHMLTFSETVARGNKEGSP